MKDYGAHGKKTSNIKDEHNKMADEVKTGEALIYFQSKSQILELGYSKRQIRMQDA